MAKQDKIKDLSTFANSIHQVEGFNPHDATSEVANADGNGVTQYLPLIYKKMWARKVYPYHRCEAEIKSVKGGIVSAYARFYPTADLDKSYTGEGFAFLQIVPEMGESAEQAQMRTSLLAIGSAKSRAYTDAGFGYQFFTDDCLDDTQAEMLRQTTNTAPLNAKKETDSPIAIGQYVPEDKPITSGRKTQIEMLEEENSRLQTLSDELPSVVSMFATATVGSSQYEAAAARKEMMETEWNKTLESIKSRLTKKAVQTALSKNPIDLVSDTFEKAWETAKEFVASSEQEVIETAEEIIAETEVIEETTFEIPTALIDGGSSDSSTEQLSFFPELTVSEAKNFVLSTDSPSFDGKKIGDIYSEVKFSLLAILNKTSDTSQREALIKVIESDSELKAAAERKGVNLVA